MNESLLFDLLSAIDMVVMERQADGSFQLNGAALDWFVHFCPESAACRDGLKLGKYFAFLENFLIDAEAFWQKNSSGLLKSGIWIETDSLGGDSALEATAVSLGEKKILLIELCWMTYAEKQHIIQKGRDLDLEYHRIRRLEKALQSAQVGLKDRIRQRTEKLFKANELLKQEIAERKRVEKALLESTDTLRAILAASPVGIGLVRDQTLDWANKALDDLLDPGERSLSATEARDYFSSHEDWGSAVHEIIAGIERIGIGRVEINLLSRTDREVCCFLQGSPLDPQDLSRGIILATLDITERKRAEEGRILLTTAIEHAAESVIITDSNGTIQYVNPAFEHTTGYTRKEAIGSTPRILKSGSHDAAFYRALWDKLSVGDVWSGHFINRRKDGSLYEVDETISPVFDSSGNIINYVAVKRDVTQEIKLKKQIYQAQKMEAIGTLAGGIAHDFNNILAPIIGYCELALQEIPADTRLCGKIEQVLRSGYRAKDLVKQILTFSRKTEQELRPVQVSFLVKETLQMLRSTLPSTIEIRRNIDRDATNSTVMADPTQIHQVLMNLCTNAAHAMREKGGVLSIALTKVDLNSTSGEDIAGLEAGSYLRLSVSDTGHGIEEVVRQQIFDPYFTTKGPDEGTGLGLAVVYGIVKDLSGGITVSSNPGEGTTFQVFFPITGTSKTASEAVSWHLPTGKGRILVVDDEKNIVEMMKEMLEQLGYEVAARYGSADALEVFQAQPEHFDLVITDQTMPHLTGTDLAKEMLKIRPDIPIIVCTGFSAVIDVTRASKIGIKAVLMKPVALQQLAEEIHKLLNQG